MIDNTAEKIDYNSDSDFEKAFNDSFKNYEENSLIKAKVIDISSDLVFLDFGYKSEAKISTSEFDVLPKIGDEVELYLIMLEGRSGEPVVSKKKRDYITDKKELVKIWRERKVVTGIVKEVKNGGFIVEYKNVNGFIPYNLFDSERINKPEEYLNKEINFYIERLDFKDNQYKKSFAKKRFDNKKDSKDKKDRKEEEFVGNRKRFLYENNSKVKDTFLEEKNVGDIVEGKVKNITDFGAFINLGGIDALLRGKDVSWLRITNLRDVLKENQQITVKILSIDKENKKITVGLKQLQEDPWDKFIISHNVGDTVVGSVVSITTYGAFVKIVDGVEGLLHISDMSWVKKIKSPNDIVHTGQNLELKIIKLDKENKKLSLSLKHLMENPWDNAKDKYKVGTIVKGKIVSITTFGVFIELEEGVEALLHIEDYSWSEIIRNPHEKFKINEEIEAKVTQFDEKNLKIKVSVKDLIDDPWKIISNYKNGEIIDCVIENIEDDKGINVKISDQIKAFIPISHISTGRKEEILSSLREDFKPGDKAKAMIINMDFRRRKISLSIREYQKKIEHEKVESFLHNENEEVKYTLEDYMKNKESN